MLSSRYDWGGERGGLEHLKSSRSDGTVSKKKTNVGVVTLVRKKLLVVAQGWQS